MPRPGAFLPPPLRTRGNSSLTRPFLAHSPLTLPLRFSLLNLSPSTSFTYVLCLSPFSASSSSASRSSPVLAGPLTHRGALDPLGRARVDASLWVTRPGVFGTGTWELVLGWAGDAETGEGGGSVRLSGDGREVRVRDREGVVPGAMGARPVDAAAGVVQVRA